MESNSWEEAEEFARRHEEREDLERADEVAKRHEEAMVLRLAEAAKNAALAELAAETDLFFRDQMTYLRGVFVALEANDAVIQRVCTALEDDYRSWHGSQFAGRYETASSSGGPQLRLGM
jgi:hypothetical protein